MEPLARHRCDVSATQLPFFPAESLALSDALMPRNFIELVTELLQRSSQLCFWALWVEGAAKAPAGARKTFLGNVESNACSYNWGGPPIPWKRAIYEGQSRWRRSYFWP